MSLGTPRNRPRAWPALAAGIGAPVLGVLLQLLVVLAWKLAKTSGQDLRFTYADLTPELVLTLLLISQATFGLVALLAARLSREPLALRLNAHRPRLRWRLLPLLVLASIAVSVLGAIPVEALARRGLLPRLDDPIHMQAIRQMSLPGALLMLAAASLGPGLCEELLYRGCVQTRLVSAWGSRVGIVVSSMLFAAAHVNPTHALGVLPIALWLGWLARRAGSILPGMICHAGLNATLIALELFGGLNPDTDWHPSLQVAALGVALAILAMALRLLHNIPRADTPLPDIPSPQ